MSYGHDICKWLDHLVGRSNSDCEVTSVYILQNMVGSDHLPLCATLSFLDQGTSFVSITEFDVNSDHLFVDWDNLTKSELSNITYKAFELLEDRYSDSYSQCTADNCNNRDCLDYISIFYNDIRNCISIATQPYAKKRNQLNKFKIIPGWNRNVKDLYKNFREDFIKWVEEGKLLDCISHDNMRISRSIFKTALKECKSNKENEILLSIEEQFKERDRKKFWQEVSRRKGSVQSLPSIDGEIDVNKIIDIFSNKFLPPENKKSCPNVDDGNAENFNICISGITLRNHIDELNEGKGHDNIHSLLLKYSSDEFIQILVNFMNFCFCHCFLPIDILKGDIFPIIKDKKGSKNDPANYRPVMQSSCLLKLFELHILSILEEKINLCHNQFGFTKGHSTTDATFLLKDVIHSYINKKSKVYCNFLDLSKAFDLVDHEILMSKLVQRGIPRDLVKIISSYLFNQSARIL